MTGDTAAIVSRDGNAARSIIWLRNAIATGLSGSSADVMVAINARYPVPKNGNNHFMLTQYAFQYTCISVVAYVV